MQFLPIGLEHLEKRQKFLKQLKYMPAHIIVPIGVSAVSICTGLSEFLVVHSATSPFGCGSWSDKESKPQAVNSLELMKIKLNYLVGNNPLVAGEKH